MAAKKPQKPVIKFIEDYTVQDEREGTPDEESYNKGQRKAMEPASAEHFVSRGKAVYLKGAPD